MKRFLAGVALGALFFASSANATVYNLTLTGDMTNFTSNSFMSGSVFYETGLLELTGFTPFTLQDGDTVNATVHIVNGPFVLPVRDQMFFGFNLDNVLGGAQPTGSSSNGTVALDGGTALGAGCGNCTSLIFGQNNSPFSFVDLDVTGAFQLVADYEVNHISVSYQVNNNAVPEPATWALMILGFGAAGSMIRRRRRPHAFAAA